MDEPSIGFKARLVSMFLRLLTLGLIAVALMISTEGIVIVLLLFVLVVPFEKLFPRHRGQKLRLLPSSTMIPTFIQLFWFSNHKITKHSIEKLARFLTSI